MTARLHLGRRPALEHLGRRGQCQSPFRACRIRGPRAGAGRRQHDRDAGHGHPGRRHNCLRSGQPLPLFIADTPLVPLSAQDDAEFQGLISLPTACTPNNIAFLVRIPADRQRRRQIILLNLSLIGLLEEPRCRWRGFCFRPRCLPPLGGPIIGGRATELSRTQRQHAKFRHL
jgi:hypothetical protein